MRKVEVCCGSYEDCVNAYHAHADRAELNSGLSVGGLTPTVGTLLKVKADTDMKVICMIRPRAAGFCYDQNEIDTMFLDAKILLENGADGIAFGFLHSDHTIDVENTGKMTELIHSYQKEAVFHRAFDVLDDPFEGMQKLIDLKVDRVLTSGQKAKAIEGKELIRQLYEAYGEKIQILAGSGMNADNAKEMMEYTGVEQIHSSCKSYREDLTSQHGSVSFSYLNAPHENDYDAVDRKLVEKLVEAVKQ